MVNASSHVLLELIDLESDSLQAESVSLPDFLYSLKEENFVHIRKHAQKFLVGSTFTCEQTFSV